MDKFKKLIVYVVVFFAGMFFMALSADTKVPENKVIQEVVTNEETWRKLKAIDDAGFSTASDMMGLCSSGFTAAANLDADEIDKISIQMGNKVSDLGKLGAQRQEVLRELGY